ALPRASQPPANGARAFSPYAALLRDERDAERPVVGTTWGGTICWSPRKPSKLAAVSSDGRSEHVIRCGECAGCREFFRRRQARRLHALYGDGKREVWILEVAVSIGEQSALCERMNRTRLLSGVSGFFRLSPREIALIVVGPKPRPAAVRMLRQRSWTLSKVRLSRGLRAWSDLTRGLLVSREFWERWTNRFYHRGLPPPEKESFAIATRGGLLKRHRELREGARAWRDGVALYPPEAWRPPRPKVPKRELRAHSGQPLSTIGELLKRLLAKGDGAAAAPRSPVIAGARQRALSESSMPEFRNAPSHGVAPGRTATAPEKRGPAAAQAPPHLSTETLPCKGDGYRGSLQSRSATAAISTPDFIAAWLKRMLPRGDP
ncbi:MAG TPA: hypothetical protein VNF49_08170, partial [Candidatus Binataceae bacterium]|nr:hypothetical protein [Candidatus Binataceae bacterium]